jgi:phage terminase small subunit
MPGPLPNPALRGGAEAERPAGKGRPRPKPPAGLDAAGKKLWKSTQDDLAIGWELDARDLEILTDACHLQDTIAALEKSVKRDGETYSTEKGPRLNPAVAELRYARSAKSRLLRDIDMDERQTGVSGASQRAQNAANVRWELQRKKRGSRGAA